jgi:2-polyprenyl-3-methyl-5-hydroxy-6-metoxy-1,4-benzoquinol methylase
VHHLDVSKLTHVYGVEPCLGLHAELRQNVVKAGLESVYEILPCGAEELGKHGISKGSVDTVVCCKVLCGVPEPERVLRELYEYVKPGGQFVVYEHVANRRSRAVGVWQSGYSFLRGGNSALTVDT